MASRWRIYQYWKVGMSLVTFQVACTYFIEAAFQFIDDSPVVKNKRRGFLIKPAWSGKRIYSRKQYYAWQESDEFDEDNYSYADEEAETPPPEPEIILLPEPKPVYTQDELFKSVWRASPPTKRRL